MALLPNLYKRTEIIICLFFPLIMMDYLLIMLGINLNNIIVLPMLFFVACFAFLCASKSRQVVGTKLLTIFLVYNVASVLIILVTGIPFDCYIDRLRSFLFPMLFFYFGVEYRITSDKFYKSFLYSSLFCFVVGFFLYLFTPSFYVSFLVDIREQASYIDNVLDETTVLEYTRFSSFFGSSYAISYFSIPALCVSFAFLFRDKLAKKHLLYLSIIVCFLAALLCQQRIAMVSAFAVALFYSIYGTSHKNGILLPAIVILAFILIIVLNMYVDTSRLSTVSELIFNRFARLDFNDAMGERTGQYDKVLNAWNNIILGDGMGAHSGAAMIYKYVIVADGEYYRILVENGIIGITLFISLIFGSLKKAIINRRYLWMELIIVSFFLLAGIGANSLSVAFFYTPIFWFCLGRIWNKGYLERLKLDNKYIR